MKTLKSILRLKTKELVISEFLNNAILWALREKLFQNTPYPLKK